MTKKQWLLLVGLTALGLATARTASPSSLEPLALGYVAGSLTSKVIEKVSPKDKWARFFIPVALVGFGAWAVEWAKVKPEPGYSDELQEHIGAAMLGAGLGATIEIPF